MTNNTSHKTNKTKQTKLEILPFEAHAFRLDTNNHQQQGFKTLQSNAHDLW
jgi:hypothetical protein